MSRAQTILAVAAGGVVGALARYGANVTWPTATGTFGWTTLAVNASGCLLIGLLLGRLHHVEAPSWVRPALGTGVLGGYTTFSGFAADAVALFDNDEPFRAIAYLGSTLLVAVVAVWLGLAITRRKP